MFNGHFKLEVIFDITKHTSLSGRSLEMKSYPLLESCTKCSADPVIPPDSDDIKILIANSGRDLKL